MTKPLKKGLFEEAEDALATTNRRKKTIYTPSGESESGVGLEKVVEPIKKKTVVDQPETAKAESLELLTEASIKFFLPNAERSRAERFIRNEYSPDNGLSELCRKALKMYLDKAELKVAEIEKALRNFKD